MLSYEVIEALPQELAYRLENDDYFTDIPVVVAGRGNVAQQVARKQAAITEKTGKRGIAVVVLPLVADDNHPNLPFGPLMLRPAFQVVENVELNQDAQGTQKAALEVSRRIRDVLKSCGFSGLCKGLVPDNPVIEPLDLEAELGPASAAYQVNFRCMESDRETISQVANPVASAVGGSDPATFALTCATEGATIYYTTDESYPGATNSQASIYTGPIAIGSGVTCRACAYKAGMIGSWVMWWEVTAEEIS